MNEPDFVMLIPDRSLPKTIKDRDTGQEIYPFYQGNTKHVIRAHPETVELARKWRRITYKNAEKMKSSM